MLLPALFLVQAAAVCPATPAPLPAELAGWATTTSVAAGTTPASLTIGRRAHATLLPSGGVRLAATTAHPPAADTHGGVFAVEVPRAGRYRVALGAGVWIDVVRDGHALASVAHGHGPACSPVRKMVDFDLQPGRYLMQVVGVPAATLDLLVAPLP